MQRRLVLSPVQFPDTIRLAQQNKQAAAISASRSPYAEILGLCAQGSLLRAFQLLDATDPALLTLKPNLFSAVLHACTNSHAFLSGLQLHGRILKSGLDSDRYVGNSLLAFYFKLSPCFADTRKVFDGLYYRDAVSWTSLVSGYVRAAMPQEALDVFREMLNAGMAPNGFTLSAAIKACSEAGDTRLGRCLHAMAMTLGYQSNHVIYCALTDMYGRNAAVAQAKQVFMEVDSPDAFCWTAMISALTRNDMFEEAVGLFYSMHRMHGLVPDGFTFGTLLTALGNLGRVKQGRQVHAKVITQDFRGNVFVESSLVDMYSKSKLISDSRRVFDRISQKNAVSWCAMIGGYCHNNEYEFVLQLFRAMDTDDEHYSFATVLRACAALASVKHGKEVHCQFLRTSNGKDVIVESSLVDLYAKCGLADYADKVFKKMEDKNLITWNTMICGLARNGRGHETVKVFDDMIEQGLSPDFISFIGVLFACSHSGLVNEGKKYFGLLRNGYSIKPRIEHYNCMTDLLGRAKLIEEAEDLIRSSPFRDDSSLWETLLGACITHTNSVVAERVARRMIELEPDYHLSYVLLSNIYRTIGRWDDALKVTKMMDARGARKTPGRCWIDVKSKIHSYLGFTESMKP